MRRFRPRRCVRGLWEGLVAYGRLCLAGETDRYDHPPRPRVRWHRPPPGHPERVRDDMPLTDLERRLARELADEDHDVR
ncbi:MULTISPECIES: DUF6059 family protein [Streptomyces]|uniref:DUF6059 family protein n=1 Tax=Streptomyces TaxID=1883 RepID=UPI000FB5E96E|nr:MULTISPECIES: DUF6059 family protein [unclassified Streptomyces]MBU8553991.1 hypothetical protein [Streptomyces sp. Osf17]MBU8554085.1 hypothetical protein [Streptomyces sp. Babs14]RSS31041.1 hypothetical protein EF916_06310 [Streptomyces sp. WAC08452]